MTLVQITNTPSTALRLPRAQSWDACVAAEASALTVTVRESRVGRAGTASTEQHNSVLFERDMLIFVACADAVVRQRIQ